MKKFFLRYAVSQLMSKTSERLWAATWVVTRLIDLLLGVVAPEMAESVKAFREPAIALVDSMLVYVLGRFTSKAVKGPQGQEIP